MQDLHVMIGIPRVAQPLRQTLRDLAGGYAPIALAAERIVDQQE
jgi:hypothetical protein